MIHIYVQKQLLELKLEGEIEIDEAYLGFEKELSEGW